MGRIKSKAIKRTSQQLILKTPDSFNCKFEDNKNSLRGLLPSKKIRNQVAGYITRLKKQEIIAKEHGR